jgi:predicted GNAT superfamily acetyltransferase
MPPEGLTIRRVATIAEYDACEEMQRRAWGYADIDVVPTNELVSAAKAGGLVLGAFEGGGRLAGFCFGLVGRDHATGRAYHYSRMVGVEPEMRGRGVAQALKLAQRDEVVAQGLDLMRWTFEPLAAENATLNIARLGAEAVAYVRDMYGDATTSPLHAGIGTDRLVVEWRLRAPRRPALADAPRVAIPRDLAALRKRPEEARRERARVRAELEAAFAAGLVAVEFRDGAYLLASASSTLKPEA